MTRYLHGRLVLALLAGLGCRPAVTLTPVVPVDIAPVSEAQVAAWVDATVPDSQRLYKFEWLFFDGRSTGGQGAARLAPPDSLRFDAAGPFNTKPTAAVVIGDAPLWVDPPDALEKLVPNYPLFWAMFGIARRPAPGATLRGLEAGATTAWQYALGADTVEYRYTRGQPSTFVAEARQAGEIIGHVETTLADGVPQAAKLLVPSVPAWLKLTFTSTTRTTIAPEIWLPSTP